MIRTVTAIFILTFLSTAATAQKDPYKFAQTYFGLQADGLIGSDTPNLGSARFLIGGTHFWQKADFYISIPLVTRSLEGDNSDYKEGVITGFRYIPFGFSRKMPRPFIGAQWLTPEIRLSDGPRLEKSRFGIEGGFNLAFGSLYTVEVSGHYLFDNDLYYPTSRESIRMITAPSYGISVAFKKYLDSTAGLSSPESKAYVQKHFETFEEEGRLSTWNFAIGLSANVAVSDLDFLKEYSFMPNRPPLSLYPDIALGYYFHELDAAIRVSWRPMKLSDEAYGLSYEVRQHRLAIEGFKFLFDYHGFLPFLGLSVGNDFVNAELIDGELAKEEGQYTALSYGITFGWDIRPTRIQNMILRTNLRYTLQSNKNVGAIGASGNNLEINFIQFVIYPSRWK
ncbi:MAG: hypothetical protein MK086_13005 [Flavobacteriales bacterium]|nr:hypothetical protein [Flavobacteriales bacterium]